MSALADEILPELTKNMICAKHRLDIPIELKNSKNVLLTSNVNGQDVEYTIANGKELIVYDGNSDTRMIRRRFDLDFNVKKIFYHSIIVQQDTEKCLNYTKQQDIGKIVDNQSKKKSVLVICGEHRLVFVSTADYHLYHYEVPFKIRNVFSVNDGILIARHYDASTEQSFHYHDTFHLYSLSGPFGELLPVIYKTIGYQPHWKFCWQSHQDDAEVVGTDRNFVVVHDEKENVHRVYVSRETREEEVQSAIKFVETQRKHFNDSTIFAATQTTGAGVTSGHTRTPQNALNSMDIRSPAMIALSEVINSEIEGRSPFGVSSHTGFGHSTPNTNFVYQGSLPTPIFDGASDSKIWSTTPGTPKMVSKGGMKTLERNIHNKVLARIAQPEDAIAAGTSSSQINHALSPFNNDFLQCRTPTLPYQKWKRERENAELLREFTRMIRDTPRRQKDKNNRKEETRFNMGDLDRDPDLDLLLSKICLECIYIESKEDSLPKANKIFVSVCLMQTYLNLVSNEMELMKVLPIWDKKPGTKKIESEKVCKIKCKDASSIQKNGLTVALESNFVALYSGNKRISMIYVKDDNFGNGAKSAIPTKLYTFSENSFVVEKDCQILSKVELAPSFYNEIVREMMKNCFIHLPFELSQMIYCKWRSLQKSTFQLSEIEELTKVFNFLLEMVGISLKKQCEQQSAESPEVGGKQRKPKQTQTEVLNRIVDYLNECDEVVSTKDKEKIEICFDANKKGNLSNVRKLMYAIHGQFEAWTLVTTSHHVLSCAIKFLYVLARVCGEELFVQYYKRIFGNVLNKIVFEVDDEQSEKKSKNQSTPLELLSLISKMCTESSSRFVDMWQVVKCIPTMFLRILLVIACGSGLINENQVDNDCRTWFGENWKSNLHLKKKKTLKMFLTVLESKTMSTSEKATSLMTILEIRPTFIENLVIGVNILLLKYEAEAFSGTKSLEPKDCLFASPDENQMIWEIRWPHDIRVKNAEVMLDSTKPVLLVTNLNTYGSDMNLKEGQDSFLNQTAIRSFSQAFGQALFSFRQEVPSLLQPLDIPQIAHGGILYPARVTCDPPTSETFRLHSEWAEFYNSTAAALKVGSNDMVKIDNEWMLMTSKSGKNSPNIAGMIFGFGLNGHLSTINMYHAHQMLATFDRFHSIALLIGLASSKKSSCDMQVYKILATYLQFLMGPTMLEIRLDCTIQTAAISALGILFANSGNMNVAKKLANEIGKSPNTEDEPVNDRVAYKLSAGFALGLIMLGKGNGVTSSTVPFKQKIPSLSKRLLCMMNGGLKKNCVFVPQTAPPTVQEINNLPFGSTNGGPGQISNQTPNHVQEGPNINVHLSSQASTIALGFMFMKTNNEFIADQLRLPSSIAELEKIRPDFIFCRVLSCCLVTWDSIELDDGWVNSQVPEIVQKYMVCSMKYGNEKDVEMTEEDDTYWDEVVDRHTLSQTYLYAVSAACLAIALKFMGDGAPDEVSQSVKAFQLLERFISIVLPEEDIVKREDLKRVCKFAGKSATTVVFSMLVTAMSIVRAGTGDKQALRYARLLRMYNKLEKNNWEKSGRKHHEQVSAHQAIGILFMGGGRYVFKKDNLSIALVIVSVYPIICQHVADNSHYHQPLRFLWTLAVEPRLIVPFDPYDNVVVECECVITLKSLPNEAEKRYEVKAPYLLPSLDEISSIEIGGGQFEVVRINLNTEEERQLMEEIMRIGQGRIKLRRFGNIMIDDEMDYDFSNVNMFNTEKNLRHEDKAVNIDLLNYELTENEICSSLRLNSASKYPHVQQHLRNAREVFERTTKDLIGLQICNVDLLKNIVNKWPNEIYLACQLEQISENLKMMKC